MASITAADLEQDFEYILSRHELKATKAALKPLKGLSYGKIQSIIDHEEHFLRVNFEQHLVASYHQRINDKPNAKKQVTITDVRSAMKLLGADVRLADYNQVSADSKSLIRDICPYC